MSAWTAEQAARELLSILPILSRMLANELRQAVDETTTMPQFRVLDYLVDGPQTLSAIARRRRVSLQAAGELVQILVDRGWVARTPNPADRRQILLHLTEEGLARYQNADSRMQEHLIPLLEKLTPEEMAAIQIALPALHSVIAGEAEGLDEVMTDAP